MVRAATLAVREVTLAMSVALTLMSWVSVVFLVSTAAARLSRYLSRQAKVSALLVGSQVTALVVLAEALPHASIWHLQTMWAAQ